jgi:hypothetical protein
MIFKQFEAEDIVAGRTTRVASGFWPDGSTNWSASALVDDYFSLTSSATPSTAYGSSVYDVRRTLYYANLYPNANYLANNDPYLSVTYGNWEGDAGSGSFGTETSSMLVSQTKAIYSQYKNVLLGTSDADGKFTFLSGSGTTGFTSVTSNDIFVLNFSSYKMKDRVDEGVMEFSLTGSNGVFTFRDDSPIQTSTQAVYNIISGSISDSFTGYTSTTLPYDAIGLFYPQNGIVVLNAIKVSDLVGLSNASGSGKTAPANYHSNTIAEDNHANHALLAWSLENSGKLVKVRKTEYVPARHYFVRIKNRDFNYSNNPTYVYDGTDGINAKGTIRNSDFIADPKTYITTVGLYNKDNELVAVAKMSRPVLKNFESELLCKIMLAM